VRDLFEHVGVLAVFLEAFRFRLRPFLGLLFDEGVTGVVDTGGGGACAHEFDVAAFEVW